MNFIRSGVLGRMSVETIKNIFCVGRNYVKHVEELGNVLPDEPVIFSKPTHSLVKAKDLIELPADRGEIHYETELVLKITGDYERGIGVDEIVSEMTIGLDLTLRDEQTKLKAKAHPWLLSKGFPQAAVLGEFISFPGYDRCKETSYSLRINGHKVQDGDINKMIFSLDEIITYIGENIGLAKGDLIFTGTPEGVGPLHHNDELEMLWGDKQLGKAKIKLEA